MDMDLLGGEGTRGWAVDEWVLVLGSGLKQEGLEKSL